MTCFFYPVNIRREVVTKARKPRRYLCLVARWVEKWQLLWQCNWFNSRIFFTCQCKKCFTDASLTARHVLISCKHCQRFVTFGGCDAILASYSINVVNIIPDLYLNRCQMNVIIFCVFMKPWDVPWDSVWETLGFGSQFWEISTMILGFRKILAGNTGLATVATLAG